MAGSQTDIKQRFSKVSIIEVTLKETGKGLVDELAANTTDMLAQAKAWIKDNPWQTSFL